MTASRTELVTHEIHRAILDGRLRPGQQIVERELAAQLGVSKTPIREALKVLVGTGLVVTNPYRGMTVRTVDKEMITDLYQVRVLLEPPAVAVAVQHHTESTVSSARKILQEAREAAEAGDRSLLGMLNRSFHRALYEPCQNGLLVALLDELSDQLALVAVSWWAEHPTWQAEADEHEAIITAIASGDSEQAAELTRHHSWGAERKLVENRGE